MANYKEIKGKTVLHIASDLTTAEGEGQIWFNTTSSDFKTISLVAGAWATGGNLNTARRSGSVGADDSDAATYAAGTATDTTDIVESYDGSSWTEIADINTARYATGGGGTSTAMLICAGTDPDTDSVEEWNGSTWTEIADVNSARYEGLGFSGTVNLSNDSNSVSPFHHAMFSDFFTRLSPFQPETGMNGTVSGL